MRLDTLYENIVLSFGLTVQDDGAVFANSKHLKINNLPVYIPTRPNIDTVAEKGQPVKYLFNIFDETITSHREDIKKMLRLLNINTSFGVRGIMADIINALKVNTQDLNLELASLLSELGEIRGRAKVLVDDRTIHLMESLAAETKFIKVNIKRGAKIKGEKTKIGVILSSPYLEFLENGADKSYRRKDRELFIFLMKYILDDITGQLTGSNHDVHPEANAILGANIEIYQHLAQITEELEFELFFPELLYGYDDVAMSDTLRTSITLVPNTEDGSVTTQRVAGKRSAGTADYSEMDETATVPPTASGNDEPAEEGMISIEEARQRRWENDPYKQPAVQPTTRQVMRGAPPSEFYQGQPYPGYPPQGYPPPPPQGYPPAPQGFPQQGQPYPGYMAPPPPPRYPGQQAPNAYGQQSVYGQQGFYNPNGVPWQEDTDVVRPY